KLEKFSLCSGKYNKLYIDAGDSKIIPLYLSDKCNLIYLEFLIDNDFDINVNFYKGEINEECLTGQLKRIGTKDEEKTTDESVKVLIFCNESDIKYFIEFDNKFSWINEKYVYYNITLCSETKPL
ncbi:MAG: hypothetical protein MJ252_12295, partial [archaeon]|nr:hypothetical protein [archaeon]